MLVVLIRPNYDAPSVTPYLGLAYLSSSLKANGIDSIVIDNLLHKYSNKKLIKKIKELKPDCVGISCLSAFYNEVKELSLQLKKLSFRVIIGGVHPSFLPYTTLKETNCDFVICGEGEIALPLLLKNNFNNTGIKGIYKITDINSDKKVEFADVVENMDDLPFPDWEQFNPIKYPVLPMGGSCKNTPIGIIMTTRGCLGHCAFCASPVFYKNKVRFRSPENVVAEIELLKEKYCIKEIHFLDDNPIIDESYAYKLFNLMIEKKIDLPWHCVNGIRADSITKELAILMKKAGCYQVAIGIESANNEILKNIGKGETIQQISKSIEILHEAGIEVRGNFILGLPGETKETIEETINYSIKSKLDKAAFYVLDIVPGSPLWRTGKYKSNLSNSHTSYIKPNWIADGLNSKYIEKSLSKAYRKFYLRPTQLYKILKDIKPTQYICILHRLYKIFS